MSLSLISFNGMGGIGRHSPSLALLQLAPVVWQEGVKCDIVDIQALIQQGKLDWANSSFLWDAAQHICSYGNRYLGFSTRCDTYPYVLEVARRCRHFVPDAVIIFGGPQATSVDLLTLETFPFVDLVVRGEGEITLRELIGALENGERLEDIAGITFRDAAGTVRRNHSAALIQELGILPFPAYYKYDELYGDIDPEYGDIELGRGCPFTCNFCFTAEMWERRYRVCAIDKLLEKVRFLRNRYGVRRFRFVHDNVIFKCSPYIDELIARFTEERPAFTWSASTRVDTLDLSLLPSLHKAGLSDLYFGIETGVDDIKDQLNKRFSFDQVRKMVRELEKSHISATLSFIVGFPTEDREDLEETLSFALNCAVHQNVKCVQFHSLAPTTGTRLYSELKDRLRYDGTYSNHNGAIPMREPSIRRLIQTHRDIFSSFYTIVRSAYPVDLPFAAQEVMGCLVNFFPMTIKLITHELQMPVLEFLEVTLNWMVKAGRRWQYGLEPHVDMEQVIRDLYVSRCWKDEFVATLCRYEAAVYQLFLKGKTLAPHEPPAESDPNINVNDRVAVLSPFAQLITSEWEPYALFEWVLERRTLGTNAPTKPLIPRSYHVIQVASTRNGYSVRRLGDLEFHLLSLMDGHRSFEEVLNLLESQHGLYRSQLLRRHLRGLLKRLLLEGILECAVRPTLALGVHSARLVAVVK